MKRVLVITYYWPPTGGSGVQRWVKFSKYLPQMGWQPIIYTPSNPEQLARDESLLGDIPPEVEVIKRRIMEPYGVYNVFKRIAAALRSCKDRGTSPQGTKRRENSSEVNPLNAGKKTFFKRLAVAIRGNFFIPDPRVGWVRPSVRFLRKYLREHPVDVVVTTGPPQSMHLIGRGLKRATGVRWIADFRDPWTDMFYFKHMGLWKSAERCHHRLEQSVLDEADAVISVTPLVQKDFQAKTETPVYMITNGFDADDFCAGGYPQTSSYFTLVHTGLFAADGNPIALWDALADKCSEDSEFRKSLQIRLAGKVDAPVIESIRTRGLGDNLVELGYVPHNDTVMEQAAASILMLPLRQEPEYLKVLPGKIFEYLAARRPVLGIGQENGVASIVLRDAGAGEMFDWDKAAEIRRFVDARWEEWRAGNISPVGTDIDKYSRKELTRKLVEVL